MARRPPLARSTALWGLSAICLLVTALGTFSVLNPDFHLLDDYISKLGALGQPYATGWNLVGFMGVGALVTAFGFSYGRYLGDGVVGTLLALFGIGLAATAVPVDLNDDASGLSKIHVVAICIGLGAYMFSLARLAHKATYGRSVHRAANMSAGLLGLVLVGSALQLWSIPIAHRLVFLVVFGWMGYTSLQLLRESPSEPGPATP